MRLITLNTWGGQVTQPFFNFLEHYENDIDVFCFQEVFNVATLNKRVKNIFPKGIANLHSRINTHLPLHTGTFARAQEHGLSTFYKPPLKLLEEGNVFVFRWLDSLENDDQKTLGRNLQYLIFADQEKRILIINFHGLWNGAGKTDTPDRINQSKKVKEVINRFNLPTILCGDFNLSPDTKSLTILEEGMVNLVKTHRVTSTRTSFYEKENKFADYILVSPEITVKDFKVLPDEVSDHSPLYLEFEV